jgi:hypothetical protein
MLRRRRAVRRRRSARSRRPPRLRTTLTAAQSTGSRRDDALRRKTVARCRSVTRRDDALRRARPAGQGCPAAADRRSRRRRVELHDAKRTCTSAPVRCTTPPAAFSWSAPSALGVPIVMMDGWSAEATLQLIEQRGITTHAWCRRCSTGSSPARRGEACVRPVNLALHPARRAPCPVEEATADGVAQPGRVGVLRPPRVQAHS